MLLKIVNQKKEFLFFATFLVGLFFVLPSLANATTYYIATSGSDTNNGTSTSTPWKTLAKVKNATFNPGDNILFKRGDSWEGGITVSSSGASGNPITYGAYGTGDKPVITGFKTISSWTNLGEGIYEASCPSCLDSVNVLTINGVNTGMGRYPNYNSTDGGFLRFESHTSDTSITDNQLTETPNWTGAEVVIRSNRWTLSRKKISSHSGGTLTFPATGYQLSNGSGYFIQNDPRTLDQIGEWYYNPSTKKIQIYFGGNNPASYIVKVSAVDNLIFNYSKSNLIFENLSLNGGNVAAIYLTQSSQYNNINNIDVSGIGQYGVLAWGSSSNLTIENSTFDDINETAVYVWGANTTVRNNNISDVGLIPGMGITYTGISANGNDSITEYNSISNIGYNGIHLRGNNSIIKNNLIDTFCLVVDDGGGVYTGGITNYGKVITGNIVLNGVGNYFGAVNYFSETPSATKYAEGIYIDEPITDITVSNNSVSTVSDYAMIMHESWGVNIIGNTFFNASNSQIVVANNNTSYPPLTFDTDISNNIFFAKKASQMVFKNITTLNGGYFGMANNNYYARPVDDNLTFYLQTTDTGGAVVLKNLAGWQAYSGYDTNSHISPISITDPNDILFEYNATKSNRTISLSRPMIDVAGAKYASSVTLLPYTSVILMPDPNPDTSPAPTPTPDTTSPTISSISHSNITNSAATITWNTNENSTSQIEYGATTSYGSLSIINQTQTQSHTVTLSNLRRGTTYHYRVKSLDSSSNLAIGADKTFTTASRLPKIPKIRSLTATKGSVNLAWLMPVDDSGETYELYKGVIIMKSTEGYINEANINTSLVDVKSPALTYKDTNVVNGTKYYYSVFAYDDLGSYSDPEYITFTPSINGGTSGGGGGGSYTPPTSNNPVVSTSTEATSTLSSVNTDNSNNTSNNNTGSSSTNSNINPEELEKITTTAKEFVAIEKKLVTKINNALSKSLAGRLLLQVENRGEAWYVNPNNNLKYYLGTPNMAFSLMRTMGVGISNSDLEKIKINNYNLGNGLDSDNDGLSDAFEDAIGSNKNSQDTDSDGHDDKTEVINSYSTKGKSKLPVNELFTKNQAGKILIQVESHGEAWYINPLNNTRYYLGRPDDAYALMRYLSLGISNSNLRKIGIGEIKN